METVNKNFNLELSPEEFLLLLAGIRTLFLDLKELGVPKLQPDYFERVRELYKKLYLMYATELDS